MNSQNLISTYEFLCRFCASYIILHSGHFCNLKITTILKYTELETCPKIFYIIFYLCLLTRCLFTWCLFPRHSLITIYKTFIRLHLDYGDVIYDRTFKESFHEHLESIQYNAAMAITGTIRGTSPEKLFQELGLEILKSRRWFRKLYLFYKIFIVNHLVTFSI